jgi:hypothetical protein
MVSYKILEIAGISIQTIVGVIFLLEQTSHLEVKSFFSKIRPWFINLRKTVNIIPKTSTSLITTILLYAILITVTLPWLSRESITFQQIPIIIYGLLFFILFSLGTYSIAVGSVLNQLLDTKKRLVPKSYLTAKPKNNFKIKMHTIDAWDVKSDSNEFNRAFTQANLIVWTISLFEVGLGFYALTSVFTSKSIIIQFLSIITIAFLAPLFLTLLVSTIYLVERLFFRILHWILSVWWQFLAAIWFLAGVLLVISALH